MEAKYVNERKRFIKSRRLALGKTLEEIGNAVGVSKTTVMRWESGDIANMRRHTMIYQAQRQQPEQRSRR